ncbi:hypothetical protein F4804DRAFT_312725 [Jackrogersella minutella]|nr:hypothetical protein F4804DRAFT_312725 [Jackrogersella minutella]
MSSRALRGSSRASRACPSLCLGLSPSSSSRLSPSVNLLPANSATTPRVPVRVIPYMWKRYSHILRTTTPECLSPTKSSVRQWPGDSEKGQTSSHFVLDSTSSSRVMTWRGFGSRRFISQSNRYLQEKNETKSKDQTHPRPAPLEQPHTTKSHGIRNVIPKILPTLTPHENIYTVPNILTFSRIAVAPFIGYAILHDAHAWALGLFAYAGVSDLLDGWIARRWKLQTVVGSVVDPMADKMLMTVLTVCLAYNGALPVWLAAIILGRDVGLGIAAIYYRWISLPPPKTFTRYWDFSLPSAEVRPTTISKYNTFLQLGLMGATMVTPFLTVDVGLAMTAFQYLVATTTVWSGLSYVFSKDAVKILSQNKDKSRQQ